MKKVFLGLALVAFLGTTVATANVITEKEKTEKSDEKKADKKKKKGTCTKAGGGCCHKGEAAKTTKTETPK